MRFLLEITVQTTSVNNAWSGTFLRICILFRLEYPYYWKPEVFSRDTQVTFALPVMYHVPSEVSKTWCKILGGLNSILSP